MIDPQLLLAIGKELKSKQAEKTQKAIGIGQAIVGKIQQRKADSMMPSPVDPEEQRMQRHFARRKRAFQTGTALASERNAMKQMLAQGYRNAFRSGGGSRGGLLRLQSIFNQGMLGLGKQARQGEQVNAAAEAQYASKNADRRLELSLLKYNTRQARAAQNLKEGKSNIMSGIAHSIDTGGQGGKEGSDGFDASSLMSLFGGNGGSTAGK